MATILRVSNDEKKKIKQIAKELGYKYNNDGSPSGLFKAIANGEVILIKK